MQENEIARVKKNRISELENDLILKIYVNVAVFVRFFLAHAVRRPHENNF